MAVFEHFGERSSTYMASCGENFRVRLHGSTAFMNPVRSGRLECAPHEAAVGLGG